jgi:hypothetical protein
VVREDKVEKTGKLLVASRRSKITQKYQYPYDSFGCKVENIRLF